ncbi:MAG: heme A synthase [Lysobacterales bacterium]|jgi:heme A synthase
MNLKLLVRISLILAILALVLSAYLRLDTFGIGCEPWPSCYGMIDSASNVSEESVIAGIPLALVLQRALVCALGLCVLFILVLAWKRKRHQRVCLALSGVTLLLIWIAFSPDSQYKPLTVMADLMAGFLVLGLLAWLEFRFEPGSPNYTQTRVRQIRPVVLTALFFVGLQITLGGLSSVNFAATACPSLPDCEGVWFPDATIYSAVKLDKQVVTASGKVAKGGFEQIAIHMAHRWGALLASITIIIAALTAIVATGETRKVAFLTLFILFIEIGLGVVPVIIAVPITLAVMHTVFAALLLLTLLKLLALSEVRWMPD